MCFNGGTNPAKPSDCGGTTPCPKVKGTPVAIDASSDSIVCKGGTLVVQNTQPPGAERDCTEVHENQHMRDWKERYGDDLCKGVPDGQLPVGGAGYDDFLAQSECKAYKVGLACREAKLPTTSGAEKTTLEAGIKRDKDQLKERKCP